MVDIQFKDFRCDICACSTGRKIEICSFFLKPISNDSSLQKFDSYICNGCGVIFIHPQMSEERLVEYYNSVYRESPFVIHVENRQLDTPIKIPGSGVSLQRFSTFYKTIKKNSNGTLGLIPQKDDVFIDYGAYQGIFLFGVSSIWDCRCIAYDYNEKGVEFAKKLFGFTDSVVAKDIYRDVFNWRAKYISLIHVFEHLKTPSRFLMHIKQNVIEENGFLYIEVPNVYAYPISEPSHFYSYSMDSLSKILKLNGFDILDMYTTGYPPSIHNYLAHNDEINIICLCRPINSGRIFETGGCDIDEIYKSLKKSYRQLSILALKRQLKKVTLELAKFIYYLLNIIVENVSVKLAERFTMASRRCRKRFVSGADD